jgi:hypothetical protein
MLRMLRQDRFVSPIKTQSKILGQICNGAIGGGILQHDSVFFAKT